MLTVAAVPQIGRSTSVNSSSGTALVLPQTEAKEDHRLLPVGVEVE